MTSPLTSLSDPEMCYLLIQTVNLGKKKYRKWQIWPKLTELDLTFQESEPDELSEKADWPKTAPVSMAWRLKELEQQILASQEEELACRLKLNGLLSIVDD